MRHYSWKEIKTYTRKKAPFSWKFYLYNPSIALGGMSARQLYESTKDDYSPDIMGMLKRMFE